ncbi:BirA family biotin operon repressor/biotin-[acetyl-CoA-carboxylase] ligase [Desulfobaculum xiamenense]|uniref:biotin--[biotin carboxyl-carrier protein] ligase n=1 Tax=Desulfobaculum xiamenense TaxID=995050 RepID=A0A846QQG9_9BACT|nr:biotin--[acetyl-CoA-carboxylase] ligase [Desulfobaculum xiamenense]NJB66919.1 BirA family biotin operon repressor/biotin-[acetyl-CoA-carboxylase] ligase [Desulfobaculum xiamenense]
MNDSHELLLIGRETAGISEALTPDSLADMHPGWSADVAAYGPWELRDGDWRSCGWRGPATVAVCGRCSSSLDVARDLAGQGSIGPWDAVLATSQTAGRGQLRHEWSSPQGNLYAAWVLPRFAPEWDVLLPLVLGVICAETLDEFGIGAQIKWPNDLLVDGRKVGGILVEERGGILIAGLGLNIVRSPGDDAIREAWSPGAASLADFAEPPTPIRLWSALVERGKDWYNTALCGSTPREFIQTITRRMAWFGRVVRIHGTGRECTARVVGLAPDGGLVLDYGDHRDTLYSGSISPA